jgi:hypothetical protein
VVAAGWLPSHSVMRGLRNFVAARGVIERADRRALARVVER